MHKIPLESFIWRRCQNRFRVLNRPSSKAAVSEEARRTLRYVESLSEARTPLADFLSILLDLGTEV